MYWASVHVNLGYMYAEGGGEGAFPGAMQKAADAFAQVSPSAPWRVPTFICLEEHAEHIHVSVNALAWLRTRRSC